jgi:hypothetical protein
MVLQPPDIEQKIVREIFQLVSKRTDRLCNFLEAGPEFGKDTKVSCSLFRSTANYFDIIIIALSLSLSLLCPASSTNC